MLNTFELIKYIFLLAAGVLQIWLMIIVYKKSPTTSNFWFMMTNNFIALCWFNVVFSEGIIAGIYHQPTADNVPTREPLMIILSFSSALTHYLIPYCFSIFVLWYSYLLTDKSKRTRFFIYFLFFLPVIIMNILFPTFDYKYFHLHSKIFWIASSVFALTLFTIDNIILIRSVLKESNRTKKAERKLICAISITSTYTGSIFFYVGNIFRLRDLYLLNIILLIFFFALFIWLAEKFGFTGFRIYIDKYRLNTSSSTISPGSSILSHELKSEISKISLNVTLMEKTDASVYPSELANIKKSILRMEEMVQRVYMGISEITIVESNNNIFRLINDCLLDLKPMLSDNNISCILKVPQDIYLSCDGMHMFSVFNNVIKNSIEAIGDKAGGIIQIETEIDKKQLTIYIRDNGKGIKKADSKYLFDAYFTTKKGSKSNLGLGLFYCYKVLMAHGGSIAIKDISDGIDSGAETSIRIPISRINRNYKLNPDK
jgi:signal transduction histidine kinase